MKSLLRITDLTRSDVLHIFRLADELAAGQHDRALAGRCVVMFFPAASLRTRLTFEQGVARLGGQAVLFPSDALDKREALPDVAGYLGNWCDLIVARHRRQEVLEQLASGGIPVVNAMSDLTHPCEVLSDLYALSKLRDDYLTARYLFCGCRGNMGLAWLEAAQVLGFELAQCCPPGQELPGVRVHHDVLAAAPGQDIFCTDSLPAGLAEAFRPCRVTRDALALARPGALLNPCPPFFRGEEVAADAIDSPAFVGYAFKKHLLTVQQAVLLHCLDH